jgi:hypothetical protein
VGGQKTAGRAAGEGKEWKERERERERDERKK